MVYYLTYNTVVEESCVNCSENFMRLEIGLASIISLDNYMWSTPVFSYIGELAREWRKAFKTTYCMCDCMCDPINLHKNFCLQYKGITILRCGCSRITRGLELMLCSLCGVEADQLCICFVCVSLHMLTLLCTLVCPPYFVVEPLNQEVGCYSVFFYFSHL